MAQCKFCGKKGLDKEGLCKGCAPALAIQVDQSVRIIKESNEIINKSKKTATRISRCETVLEIVERLRELEDKGIRTIDPPPSELHRIFTEERDDIFYNGTKSDVEKLLNKAELATTIKTSLNNANSALLKVLEAKKKINNPSKLDDLEKRIRAYTHQIQLKSFLDAADKAEFKGNTKKALDQYQEALYFLKTDDIDFEVQQSEMMRIQTKIDELQQRTLTKR